MSTIPITAEYLLEKLGIPAKEADDIITEWKTAQELMEIGLRHRILDSIPRRNPPVTTVDITGILEQLQSPHVKYR